MIFYFTGTGNSQYAATRLLDEGEQLINIADAVNNKQFCYEIAPDEKVGLVFPVYFFGLPTIVSYFISKLELEGIVEPEYLYSVITCGSSIGGADQMLQDKLEKQGYILDAVYSLKMPDNYVIMFDVPDEEKQEEILEAAEGELDKIKESIEKCTLVECSSGAKGKVLSTAAYSFYRLGRKTEKFYTDDRCIGCGACARRCAGKAIRMVDGVPTWIKERCIHCLGCTNRCGAIQYGKATVSRGRYVHPILKKKKEHSHH